MRGLPHRKSTPAEGACSLKEFSKKNVNLVRHRLEEDGSSGYFCFVCEESMSKVTTVRKIQAHYSTMRFNEGSVHGKIGLKYLVIKKYKIKIVTLKILS